MTSPPKPRRVLIATIAMNGAGGVDFHARDLALALMRLGWTPAVYSTQPGTVAEELRRATVPVVDRIDAVAARPDVIHGNHHLELLAAMARFPGVPAVFVCHDSLTWHSVPPLSPRIGAYVAVDRNCRDRMVFEHGISEESVRVITNPVDLQRFRRRVSLPSKPARALVFSNAAAHNNWVGPIRAACRDRGIALDIAGANADTFTEHPEDILPAYDLVFAKARCALEAIATGAAVVVCEARGLAGMVTTANIQPLRQLNFGARTLQRPITSETIGQEIDRYDASDAAQVCDELRAAAGSDVMAEQFIAVYEDVIASAVPISADDDLRAIGASLDRMMHHLYAQHAAPRRRFSLRRFFANSKAFAAPAQFLYQLKRRLGV